MERLTIGQLAHKTGVSRKAIRLYEEKGLVIPTVKRSDGNYRMYTNDHVFCINGIKQLRSLGVSLEETKELCVIFEKNTGAVAPQLQKLLRRKLIKIDEQIEDLQKLRQHILSFVDIPQKVFHQMEE
jgi:MerR family copper efflux transcriptional regulator